MFSLILLIYYLFNTVFFLFFAHLQLTVIHPQLPQEQPAKGSSKVDIQLQAKDSHLKIGVHGVEQPLYNLASEVAGSSQNFFANGAKEQSTYT